METTNFVIRNLQENDLELLAIKFLPPNSTFEHEIARWKTYFQEIKSNNRTTYVLELENELLGYGSLLRKSEYPHFCNAGIPEINAIWIGEEWRRKGLGTTLIKRLEDLARQECYTMVGIGVGLYQDYGPA
jgi:GNAT superfamily N-acetyltransferase